MQNHVPLRVHRAFPFVTECQIRDAAANKREREELKGGAPDPVGMRRTTKSASWGREGGGLV